MSLVSKIPEILHKHDKQKLIQFFGEHQVLKDGSIVISAGDILSMIRAASASFDQLKETEMKDLLERSIEITQCIHQGQVMSKRLAIRAKSLSQSVVIAGDGNHISGITQISDWP